MYQTEEKQPTQGAAEPAGQAADAAKKKIMKIFLMGFFGLLGLVLVASLGFGVYRAYAKGDVGGFTVTVSKVLRFPIAKVNGQTILFKDYADDLKAIRVMREFDKENNGEAASFTDEQLSDQVLIRQVTNEIIYDLGREYGIKVEKTDIDDVKQKILVQNFGSLENAEKAIKDRYGWTLPQFEEKVIRQFVLQDKLANKMNAEVKNQAQDVLNKIAGGSDFAEMAKQYGSDSTTSTGGDLGWFGEGKMVPEFEEPVMKLKKGELAPDLVESRFGYHIVKVTDTRVQKTKDEKGKTVSAPEVKASHILFQFPLGKIMSERMKAANIKIYGKINDPFPALRNPQPPSGQAIN